MRETVVVTPESAGWALTGLTVLDLAPGERHTIDAGASELIVLPLAGGFSVHCEGRETALAGRPSVFARITDFFYVPRDTRFVISTEDGGRVALPSARASKRLSPRYVAAAEVPVELRGAGRASRQVNNFCAPEAFAADRLIAVEVLTPAGNWSSYPPHKHDEDAGAMETALEEIYYYEVADGPDGPGFGYQRAYSSSPERQIDVCREVRSGDVVLLPHGYHGPSMAAPGYDLYYLNVMAGPGRERAWRFRDDPAHAWIRAGWTGQAIDERLPMATADDLA